MREWTKGSKVSAKVEFTAKEIGHFLRYFYFVEQMAQNEGYNTSRLWDDEASEFHAKLRKTEGSLGQDTDSDLNSPIYGFKNEGEEY